TVRLADARAVPECVHRTIGGALCRPVRLAVGVGIGRALGLAGVVGRAVRIRRARGVWLAGPVLRAAPRAAPPMLGRHVRAILDRMTGPSGPDPERVAEARTRMVERQLRGRGIADERVLAAMAIVPREAFLDPGQQPLAYADEALPIASGQTI